MRRVCPETILAKVFIIGAPRTGTSMLQAAMCEVFGLPGRGESHFIPGIARALEAFAEFQATIAPLTTIAEFDPQILESGILRTVREYYAHEFPEGRWVDKTPSPAAVRTVPLIYKLFPDARVICTRRTGLEVVQSAMIKFGMDIGGACATWLGPMHALMELRAKQVPLLEVEHRELLECSPSVTARLAAHIGQLEKAQSFTEFVRDRVIEATSARPTRYERLDEMPWTDEQKQYFQTHCSVEMRTFGYSY